ncbi:endonuclease/exonuclease/phosphatase family protein [Patulibacter brassicae]|uniref:Endonuclease/exonuclease/phosphatase family protein n=1 Tax=Patulibacter brassicae TaxID=1705717 RepID=A0ABU4VNH8_9ACTN|nr:endonuclease/exonuclease/phosphatase family protein [Patulibacter brassicae]MDX8153401.1 endonuclease/exonuclease/phosphatase family protein [Patulibacter brassicae]
MRIATFNLNNLFDRFNFEVQLDALPSREEIAAQALKVIPDEDGSLGRTDGGIGGLVKPKPLTERIRLAERIRLLDADVLVVQEVEHRDALREFNAAAPEHGGLGGLYSIVVCIDGNDPRRIDVGVLSRIPLGGVTSWQHVIHPELPDRPVFSRDLLEVDLLDSRFERVVATCLVTHLKSQLIPYERGQTATDRERVERANDLLRGRQAEMIARILQRRRLDRPHLVAGDMNDAPDSEPLRPLRDAPTGLVDGLADPVEEPPYRLAEDDPPQSVRWTHRYRTGGSTSYELFDQLWLDPRAAERQTGSGIGRRRRKTTDGSDHDPAWVDLDLPH